MLEKVIDILNVSDVHPQDCGFIIEYINILEQRLEKIERYIDARADIPLEVKINIKNVIHSKDVEE